MSMRLSFLTRKMRKLIRSIEVVDNTIVNQEGIIATEELFMNSGLKFYDHAYLDRVATVDGEDHRITKFEDIATYAKKPEEYNND